jgi:hypothetical protein
MPKDGIFHLSLVPNVGVGGAVPPRPRILRDLVIQVEFAFQVV